MQLVTGIGLGFLCSLLLAPLLLKMLKESGATRPNYRQESIPVGMGLLFMLVYLLLSLVLFKWQRPGQLVFLWGVAFFCLLGLVDDLLGSAESRGFKGHFAALLRGRLTTGGLKALGGGLAALLISLYAFPFRPWGEILTSTLLIALAANTINLFDLRPGRAVKVFLLWALVLLGVTRGQGASLFLAPLVGSVAAYAPLDLKARAMLGDTGSNLLGAVLGMATAWSLSFTAQLIAVVFLVLLQLITERYSLSALIEGNPLLRFLDHLGRNHD